MLGSGVLRDRGGGNPPEVTNTELFFDLVYVFALTQLSQYLYGDMTWTGAGESLVLFLAVWWAWNYTAWATGWIDPDKPLVIALMAVLAVLSMVMAAAIPNAFGAHLGHKGGDRGLAFALAYVLLQVGRSAFMVWAFPATDRMRRNYAQLLAWSVLAGIVWIAGAIWFHGDGRLAVWALAVVLDFAAPLHGFRLPGVAATPISDWSVAGGHLAERCHLVLIIAFGESFLRVGESWSEGIGTFAADSAFAVGFILTFALWALYFLGHGGRGAATISAAEHDAARIGRSGYAYAHALMVAGVIIVAVAIHDAITNPGHSLPTFMAGVFVLGPVLYLLGMLLFKRSIGHERLTPTLVGIAALAVIGVPVGVTDRLWLLIALAAVAVPLSLMAARDAN